MAHRLSNAPTRFPSLRSEAILRDIVEIDPASVLEASGLERGEVDLVHGGPPCTPFSKSGYWLAYKRAGEDHKASLLDKFVDVVDAVRPRATDPDMTLGLYAKALKSKRRRPHARRRAGGVDEAATNGQPLEGADEADVVDVG